MHADGLSDGPARRQPTRFGLDGGDSSWSHAAQVSGPTCRPSLISCRALCLYLTSTAAFTSTLPRFVGLSNSGLRDDHCKIIATLLVKDDRAPVRVTGAGTAGDFLPLPGGAVFGELDLPGNPAIGQDGYEAIIGLLNREHWIGKVSVDDVGWQAKLGLVAEMNTRHGGAFLLNGAFDSKAAWVDWIARLVALDLDDEDNNGTTASKVDDDACTPTQLYIVFSY